MALTGNYINQIKIGETSYEMNAKYWNGHEFEDLTKVNLLVAWSATQYGTASAPAAADLAKIPAGVKVKYNSGAAEATGTLAATSGDKNTIYLVYSPNIGAGVVDNYDEYMIVLEGSTYKWERLGGIGDVDLSEYAKIGRVTSGPSTANTSTQATVAITDGAASVTYSKAATVTGEGGSVSGNATDTGTAGAISYSPAFSGTEATISANVTGTAVDDHVYTPAGSITGSASVSAHTHSIGTTSTTVVTGVSATGGAGKHSHTVDSHEHGDNVATSKITGYTVGTAASCTASTTSINYLASATVTDHVLSWTSSGATTVATGVNFTANSPTTIAYTAVTAAGAPSAATLTSSEIAAHTHGISPTTATITYANANVTGEGGGATINGSSFGFSGTKATLSHTVTQGSISTTYTPAGTINGLTVAAHSHKYNAPAAHTHTIALSDATATGTASGNVPAHSHTLNSHTHTI